MKLIFALAGALFSVLISEEAKAQFVRQELYSIPSETMSPSDFLTGKKGTPVALAGHLRLPKAGTPKQPAVILLHPAGGPGGVGGAYEEWSRLLNEAGIATFGVDSYAGRGLVNLPADAAKISPLTRIVDAFRALEVIAKHPMIDPSRIAVMGFSQGGSAALYCSMARFQKMYGSAGLQFVGHISAYGPCTTRYRDDEDVTKPVLMLHGTADDFVSAALCREYAERLSKAGKSAHFIEYPGAHHLFDLPAFRTAIRIEQGVSSRRCRLEEGENGVIFNSETKQPYSPSDPCLEKGLTIAYQEAAANKSHEDVKAFLKDVFQLN